MTVPYDELVLDPQNPRLPEELQGRPQSEIFDYFYDKGVLEELVESMLDNGFFEHEPIIALKPDRRGQRVVVEGNRRLAALMLIHGHEATEGRAILESPTRDQLKRLKDIPAF